MSQRPLISNSSLNKTAKPLLASSNKENYNSKLSKELYLDYQKIKNKIKNTIIKHTDPILHSNEPETEKPVQKKLIQPLVRGRKDDRDKKPEVVSKSVDHLKSAYSIFFEKNKKGDEANKDLQDFTKKKKTNKKIFGNDIGRTTVIDREDFIPDFRLSRKYFPDKLNSVLSRDGVPTIDTEIVKKEHIIDHTGGIMSTKKHFFQHKPSDDVVKFNDKKGLIRSEFCELHNKNYRSGSMSNNRIVNIKTGNANGARTNYVNANSAFNVINPRYSSLYSNRKESNSCLIAKTPKKQKYPYAKDNMKDLLLQKEAKFELKLTPKIGNNPFDILKKVPKYDWEK